MLRFFARFAYTSSVKKIATLRIVLLQHLPVQPSGVSFYLIRCCMPPCAHTTSVRNYLPPPSITTCYIRIPYHPSFCLRVLFESPTIRDPRPSANRSLSTARATLEQTYHLC